MSYQPTEDFYVCQGARIISGLERFIDRYKGNVHDFEERGNSLTLVALVRSTYGFSVFRPQFQDPEVIDAIKKDFSAFKNSERMRGKGIFVYANIFYALGVSIPGKKPRSKVKL
ncbi:hypothetical protein J4421_01875 [Candidatus Woesearchaeota archaeon]|nr:hypothetical protein [Candidatus Woesearchaeota archaeon]